MPAWPKVGVRSWRSIGALLLVLGMAIGAIGFHKHFFFLFGVGYVLYGLLRAVLLGLLAPTPDGPPRRRADDALPLDAYGQEALPDAAADDDVRRARRRRRMLRDAQRGRDARDV